MCYCWRTLQVLGPEVIHQTGACNFKRRLVAPGHSREVVYACPNQIPIFYNQFLSLRLTLAHSPDKFCTLL